LSYLIQDYLRSVERKLAFDRRLALRACQDIEEYLDELADEQQLGPREAAQRAMAGFGDSDAVAQQYAASALGRQINRTWIGLIVAAIGAFVAMRFRAMSIEVDPSLLGSLLLWMDRFALVACFGFAAIGRLGYSRWRSTVEFCAPRTAFKLSILAIAVSMAAGLARTALNADAIAAGGPVSLALVTGAAEVGILWVAGARVRTMDRYFTKARTAA
jgi:hypothetical protein